MLMAFGQFLFSCWNVICYILYLCPWLCLQACKIMVTVCTLYKFHVQFYKQNECMPYLSLANVLAQFPVLVYLYFFFYVVFLFFVAFCIHNLQHFVTEFSTVLWMQQNRQHKGSVGAQGDGTGPFEKC